jgi:hypothetical protein
LKPLLNISEAWHLQNELIRNYALSFSLAAIHKILTLHAVKVLKDSCWKQQIKRYQRLIPVDRLKLGIMKVAPGWIRYAGTDDCS